MGIGESFPGLNRPRRQADHSPPTSAEVNKTCFFFSFLEWDETESHQTRMKDDDKCEAVGGMGTGKETEVFGENLPKRPHYLTRARTLAAAVGSRWLTAWGMAQP
jgi:hypothetical protein